MEILESISWVALGFVPTLALLEIHDRILKRRTSTDKEIEGIENKRRVIPR
jgi:hypothetical protein